MSCHYKLNHRNKADAEDLIKKFKVVGSFRPIACFFDPQYRGVLDHLSYGNEGKSRGAARSNLPQMDSAKILRVLLLISNTLACSGHLFLWVDKFMLLEDVHNYISHTPSLKVVDMLTWDKRRIGMGYRTRRVAEYLIILQKLPTRAKGCWYDHSIPDVWTERKPATHPHAKPRELIRRLILATVPPGGLVLDPCAGGFVTLDVCQELGRQFYGGDILG